MGSCPVSGTPEMVYSCSGSPLCGRWFLSGGERGFCIPLGMGSFWQLSWKCFFLLLFSWLWAYLECGLLASCWMGSVLLFSWAVSVLVMGRWTLVFVESWFLLCVFSVMVAVLLVVSCSVGAAGGQCVLLFRYVFLECRLLFCFLWVAFFVLSLVEGNWWWWSLDVEILLCCGIFGV